jgi:hypothetical protein
MLQARPHVRCLVMTVTAGALDRPCLQSGSRHDRCHPCTSTRSQVDHRRPVKLRHGGNPAARSEVFDGPACASTQGARAHRRHAAGVRPTTCKSLCDLFQTDSRRGNAASRAGAPWGNALVGQSGSHIDRCPCKNPHKACAKAASVVVLPARAGPGSGIGRADSAIGSRLHAGPPGGRGSYRGEEQCLPAAFL